MAFDKHKEDAELLAEELEESRAEITKFQQYLKDQEERDPLLNEVTSLKEENKNLHLALVECISQQRERAAFG